MTSSWVKRLSLLTGCLVVCGYAFSQQKGEGYCSQFGPCNCVAAWSDPDHCTYAIFPLNEPDNNHPGYWCGTEPSGSTVAHCPDPFDNSCQLCWGS